MKLIDIVIAIFVSATAFYISVSYIKFPFDSTYNAVGFKSSVFRDVNLMREKKVPSSSLTIKKNYKRLILGRDFRKTESINLKRIYASCDKFGERIEYSSTFPRCAGTIYADGWSISFQPVTGYMNIKDSKR